MRGRRAVAAWTALLALATAAAGASSPVGPAPVGSGETPAPLRDVGFDQRPGTALPLELPFLDETGRAVRLADLFGERPVLLVPVYYACPMLCGLVLSGVASALRAVDLEPGRDFEVVAVSFDARETPALAAAARIRALDRYGRPDAAGWHFLTGSEASVRSFTESLGFRYAWDERGRQFAHAAGVVAATPDGRLARYLLGVEPAPRDLRLALVEAGEGAIGSPVDQVLLYCFRYDPATGRYSAATLNLVRAGGVLTVAALAAFVTGMLRRERRRRGAHGKVDDVA